MGTFKVMFGEVKLRDGEDEDGNKIQVQYSDQEVDLDDLEPGVFEAIAKAVDAGLTDTGIWRFPRDSTDIAYRVVCAAAEKLGVDPPPRPTRMGDAGAIKAMIVSAEDVADQPMMGGFPPVPTSGSDSSSTSPEPTGGPEPSPDPTP